MADIVNLFPSTLGSAGSCALGSIFGTPLQSQNMAGFGVSSPLDMAIQQQQALAYAQQNALRRVEPIRNPWEQRHRETWDAYRKRLAKGVLAGKISANFVFGVYKAHAAEEDKTELAKHACQMRTVR